MHCKEPIGKQDQYGTSIGGLKKLSFFQNEEVQINKLKLKPNRTNFEKKLLLGSFPNPDILIRTGGYQRISNFMLYQLSFTDFFFLKKLWPDLEKSDVRKIINNFRKINRKFGL